jgi:hypothetical protein
MKWWKILKNANISGKAKGKGTSFDASKIKINIDKDDCCGKISLDIQNFVNDNSTVISSIFRLEDTQDFRGIGHKLVENKGTGIISNIYPSPYEMDCEATAFVYKRLLELARQVGSIPDTGKMTDMALPFKLKNYKNSKDIHKDIREWHQLKNSFFAEWKKLIRDIYKCPDLVAAIKEQGEAFY